MDPDGIASPRRFVPAVLATAAATALLLVPMGPGPEGAPFELPHVDKVAHLLIFVALAHFWRRALTGERGLSRGARLGLFAALVGYGVAIELLQGLGGTRQFEWADLAADGLGAAAVLALGSVAVERPASPGDRPQPGRTDVESE